MYDNTSTLYMHTSGPYAFLWMFFVAGYIIRKPSAPNPVIRQSVIRQLGATELKHRRIAAGRNFPFSKADEPKNHRRQSKKTQIIFFVFQSNRAQYTIFSAEVVLRGIANSYPEPIFPEANFLKRRWKEQPEALGEDTSKDGIGRPSRADAVVDDGKNILKFQDGCGILHRKRQTKWEQTDEKAD